MLVVMKPLATNAEIAAVIAVIERLGYAGHIIPGAQRTAIGITGNHGAVDPDAFHALDGIAQLVPVSQPYKLVSREVKAESSAVSLPGGAVFGAGYFSVIAGPCSVESRSQILTAAAQVKAAGAHALRGGAFKPRTSPYDFQGLKGEGLALLAEARAQTGLAVVTEVKDTESLPLVAETADMLQIGARNMQNYSLLEAVGELDKPVLLKRGMSATIKELLMAAEYIVSKGNYRVVLCERGIRTFETMTRNTLDLGAIPVLQRISHLPVIVDPSHGIGVWYGVLPLARAAVAVGADGLIIEVHPDPANAKSDGAQSLKPERFGLLMREVRQIAALLGKIVPD